MSEIPPPSFNAPPAAAAPAQRKFPVWAMVVIGLVVLCLCATCIVGVLLANGPMGQGAMAGGQLPFICQQQGYDSQTCGTWAQTVSSTPEFTTCVNDLLTAGNLNGDALFTCLVDAGVGP